MTQREYQNIREKVGYLINKMEEELANIDWNLWEDFRKVLNKIIKSKKNYLDNKSYFADIPKEFREDLINYIIISFAPHMTSDRNFIFGQIDNMYERSNKGEQE